MEIILTNDSDISLRLHAMAADFAKVLEHNPELLQPEKHEQLALAIWARFKKVHLLGCQAGQARRNVGERPVHSLKN
jgi:hypothetical protein